MIQTGIQEVDDRLGGIPVGAISELIGPSSSGRTTLAMSIAAQRTMSEQVCAWVDVDDAFDPQSAASNGVDLSRLLWVRCKNRPAQSRARANRSRPGPWARLDQALRATDLLLQSGGFAVIILDLGDISPEHGRRIPLATWFRFRQATDQARSSLVVLNKESYAQSSAALVLECAKNRAVISGGTVLSGIAFETDQQRQRFAPKVVSMRKPPRSTWTASPQWAAEKQE
ncbi:MAG TPA: hypothetical protein VKR52_02735 [Terracidiphilus sp.]|nr:hypothetical protein [Terracidiphilus sp.]